MEYIEIQAIIRRDAFSYQNDEPITIKIPIGNIEYYEPYRILERALNRLILEQVELDQKTNKET